MSRPDKIQAIGLERYLNENAAKHRELGYKAFTAMLEGKASVASMARSFNVNYRTMQKWIGAYEGVGRERTNNKAAAKK